MPKRPVTRKQNVQRQAWPKPNPALKELKVLAGKWGMELSNSSFLPSPSDKVYGFVSFNWLEDGAFLEMRQGDKLTGPASAIWLISRDESEQEYRVLYYDARGVSRIYHMSFDNDLWKMWRDAPGFSQRYEARLSEDRNTITAHWEKSSDGVKWEHDFDMTYSRMK